MKLTIERSKWAAVHLDHGPSKLLNHLGNMCCLGFLAKAVGYTDAEIFDVFTLAGLKQDKFAAAGLPPCRAAPAPWQNLMRANDYLDGKTPDYSDSPITHEREALITRQMADIGVEVTFTD